MLNFEISKKTIRSYLEDKLNKKIEIIEYKKLGTGWHGAGYKIIYKIGNKKNTIILRTIRPEGFSHDYLSDRAATFLLQHNLAKKIPAHALSLDVCGLANKKIVPIGDCKEFFQLVEVIEGKPYFEDLEKIKKQNKLEKEDKNKALLLSNYLVNLHKKKFNDKNNKDKKIMAKSIYKRHLRDCIGHGEMLMGVIDTYPDKVKFINKKEIVEIVSKAFSFKENIKQNYNRLCTIHGDFHPGNIIFQKNKFRLLDASRELFGEPADDLTCLALNYIWYAIMQKGNFSGPFKELFDIFWSNYLEKTKDYEINKIAPLFFTFRGFVVAHPIFYKDQSNKVRKKIMKFIKNILSKKEFNYKDINSYLK